MRLEEIVREWTAKGDNDLASALFLMDLRPIPLEVIGFHCQQAVEKYLKAYLVLKGMEPEKTHDLGILLERCMKYDSRFASLSENCALLSDFAVETRYPNSIPLDFDSVSQAITLAKGAVAHIAARLVEGSE